MNGKGWGEKREGGEVERMIKKGTRREEGGGDEGHFVELEQTRDTDKRKENES